MNLNGSFTNVEESSSHVYDTHILIVVRETRNVKTGKHVICVWKSALAIFSRDSPKRSAIWCQCLWRYLLRGQETDLRKINTVIMWFIKQNKKRKNFVLNMNIGVRQKKKHVEVFYYSDWFRKYVLNIYSVQTLRMQGWIKLNLFQNTCSMGTTLAGRKDSVLPLQRTQVWSLVRELKPHMLQKVKVLAAQSCPTLRPHRL